MKTFILVTFFFITNYSVAQRVTISNGRSSITTGKSGFLIELSDSFLKTTEIVAKLIDDDGKTIPCTTCDIVIQPKKGDAAVYAMTNKKSEFHFMTKNITLKQQLSSGTRVFFSFEPFNKVKYPKLKMGYGISIQ